jgi:endonuclease/exonuclease/phosphatase (EEP) superfamily protein YafD
VQLDHILAHGPGLPPAVGAGAREMALSDHRALIVDLGESRNDGMTD